jgi:hypothetical protein
MTLLERDYLSYAARLGRAARICDNAFYARLELIVLWFRARGLPAALVASGIRIARAWRECLTVQVAA